MKSRRTMSLSLVFILFLISLLLFVYYSEEDQTKKTGWLVDHETRVKVMRYEHPNQYINKNAPVFKEVLRQTNIDLEFEAVPLAHYEEKKKVALATKNFPDIIQVNQQNLIDFSESRVFLPLNEYLVQHAPHFQALLEQNPDIQKLMVGGKLYAFPIIHREKSTAGSISSYGPVIRQDLLDQHHLPVPTSFVQLADTLKTLKQLYPDSIPWTNRKGTINLLDTIAYPLGSGFGTNGLYYEPNQGNVDGRFVYGPISQDFPVVLRYLNDLYVSGVLDPNYMVTTTQQWVENMVSGSSFFYYDTVDFSMTMGQSLLKSEPEGKLELIPVPHNHKSQRRSLSSPAQIGDQLYAINAKAKNPELLIQFLDWMYSPQGSSLMNYGILGTHYTIEDGQYMINPEVRELYLKTEDPVHTMQGAIGTGSLAFGLYVDELPIEQLMQNQYARILETIHLDNAYVEQMIEPPLTTIEVVRVREIMAKLDKLLIPQIDAFIMGTKPLEEYTDFRDQLIDAGAIYLENIYNHAMNRFTQTQ